MPLAAPGMNHPRALTGSILQNECARNSCTGAPDVSTPPLSPDMVLVTEGEKKPVDDLRELYRKAGQEHTTSSAPRDLTDTHPGAAREFSYSAPYDMTLVQEAGIVSNYGAMTFAAADIPGPAGTTIAFTALGELSRAALVQGFAPPVDECMPGAGYADFCLPGPGEKHPTFEQARNELEDRIFEFVDMVRDVLPDHEYRLHEKLDGLLSHVEELEPSNTIEIKKKLRTSLVELRRELSRRSRDLQTPEIRKAYEKARNAALDIRWESHIKGYPAAYYRILPPTSAIPNFIELEDGVYRGGQADQDGVSILQSQKLKSRIDLRGDDNDNQWFQPEWSNNIRHFNIDVEDYRTPTYDQVEEFIHIMDNPENRPLYVHCRAGIGRTGTMVACWRISKGMSAEEAIKRESLNTYEGSLVQQDFIREFEKYWKTKHPASSDPQ